MAAYTPAYVPGLVPGIQEMARSSIELLDTGDKPCHVGRRHFGEGVTPCPHV